MTIWLASLIIRSNLVTGNSADNSWNYHEEFACSRRCLLLNSLLIVFCRVSGANEREARAVHVTVKLPIIVNYFELEENVSLSAEGIT